MCCWQEEEKSKESEASSRAESTDDEAGDTALPESDDMTPNMTGRQHQISFNDSVPNSPASITPGLVVLIDRLRIYQCLVALFAFLPQIIITETDRSCFIVRFHPGVMQVPKLQLQISAKSIC